MGAIEVEVTMLQFAEVTAESSTMGNNGNKDVDVEDTSDDADNVEDINDAATST